MEPSCTRRTKKLTLTYLVSRLLPATFTLCLPSPTLLFCLLGTALRFLVYGCVRRRLCFGPPYRHRDFLLLPGDRAPATGLRNLSLVTPAPTALAEPHVTTATNCPGHYSFAASVACATPGELVAFAHVAMFLPALSTLHSAFAPGMHRRIAAVRTIRTFKNYFIARLYSIDKRFSLHLLEKLCGEAHAQPPPRVAHQQPQPVARRAQNSTAPLTSIGPPLSRLASASSSKSSRKTAPLGHPTAPTVGTRGLPLAHTGVAYTVWLWESRATRICDTLSWFPSKLTMPLSSSNNLILLAGGVQDIVHALRHPSPASPLAPLTDSDHQALTQLTSILTSLVAPPTN
ncbi:hypothetical protein MHU86_5844 [Fragilaria crotonensis]|nr:hypothetical protein MHU86_5844 [Fragilaria crotonensis]